MDERLSGVHSLRQPGQPLLAAGRRTRHRHTWTGRHPLWQPRNSDPIPHSQERPGGSQSDQNYIATYRDYKYQEALFEIFARQYEIAKVDEAKNSNLFQVIDTATPPERKSKPKRSIIALGVMFAGFVAACFWYRRKHLLALASRSA